MHPPVTAPWLPYFGHALRACVKHECRVGVERLLVYKGIQYEHIVDARRELCTDDAQNMTAASVAWRTFEKRLFRSCYKVYSSRLKLKHSSNGTMKSWHIKENLHAMWRSWNKRKNWLPMLEIGAAFPSILLLLIHSHLSRHAAARSISHIAILPKRFLQFCSPRPHFSTGAVSRIWLYHINVDKWAVQFVIKGVTVLKSKAGLASRCTGCKASRMTLHRVYYHNPHLTVKYCLLP